MTKRSTLAAAALLTAGALIAGFAQPAATPPAQPSTQPDTPMAEAPDGTKLPVLSHAEYKLVVEDLKIGTGLECGRKSTVTFHYHGTLADGTVFGTSRGQEPITYPLERLIPGWQGGIPGMKVGGVRRLVVPYTLAYGEQERKDEAGKVVIPAKSDLTFAIELVDVK